MNNVTRVIRTLHSTIGKPVEKEQMRKEVQLISLLKNIMMKYPIHYAYTICESDHTEAEILLEEMLQQGCTTVEYIYKDLESF